MIRFHSFIREEEKVRSRKSVKCGKNTVLISPNSDELKEADIQPPAERVAPLSNIDIPADERAAAKARTLAKAAALRKKREEQKEEFEIEEGMTMKDFKANRKKNERKAASADAEKRGHVDRTWGSGRKYTPDEAKRSRANMTDTERSARHRVAVDPDNDDNDNYSAVKTKNPKKQRKQAAMGEMVSFSDFMEDYMRVNSDGSRERIKGDPPKKKIKPGGYDYSRTEKEKEEMRKPPKTKIGSRYD